MKNVLLLAICMIVIDNSARAVSRLTQKIAMDVA